MVERELILSTENGQNAIETDVYTGQLDSIVISCESLVTVIIRSQLGYDILRKECRGDAYIAPRSKTQLPQDELQGPTQQAMFNLNEKLDIIISGQTNTEVKLIFRLI